MSEGLTFGGWDLAMNHCGAVVLDQDGDLVDFRYLTKQKASADKAPERGAYYLPKGATDDRNMTRLVHHAMWSRRCLRELRPSFSYVEGYAFGTPKGELTGECAGAWKLNAYAMGLPFRIIDIASIKMFAAHTGNASKEAVMRAVAIRWGMDFARLNKAWAPRQRKERGTKALLWEDEEETVPLMSDPPKDLRQTEEDLCDAYVMARMCWIEWQIRSGLILPSELEDDAERRVYLRTTKAHPENVLARPWTARTLR